MSSGKWECQVDSGQWRVASGKRQMVSSGNLESFGAYKKAQELFDLVVEDVERWLQDRKL